MLRNDSSFIGKSQDIKNALDAAKSLVEKIGSDLSSLYKSATHHSDGLVYAAYSRCKRCNSGLAYKENSEDREWFCSAILRDGSMDVDHDHYPFAYWDIKSELQPSANGATTRPKVVE